MHPPCARLRDACFVVVAVDVAWWARAVRVWPLGVEVWAPLCGGPSKGGGGPVRRNQDTSRALFPSIKHIFC